MTPKQAKELRLLRAEIATLQGRQTMTMDCFESHQSSVIALVGQHANPELIEEHRDKATFYYESFLDLTIHIGKLIKKTVDLAK